MVWKAVYLPTGQLLTTKMMCSGTQPKGALMGPISNMSPQPQEPLGDYNVHLYFVNDAGQLQGCSSAKTVAIKQPSHRENHHSEQQSTDR